MGDLMIKQKSQRLGHWQSMEVISRKPWPIMYAPQKKLSPKHSFNFRPPEPNNGWREPPSPYAYQAPLYNYPTNDKKDHYYLAPYYRNAMPPPPNPNRLLMIDPKRKYSNGKHTMNDVCHCRSRSMEDVRTEVVTNDWGNDINGNKVSFSKKPNKFRRYSNRRSMDNLLVDTDHSPKIKRAGRLQVIFFFLLNDIILI